MKRKPLITWFPFRFAIVIAPLMAAWPQRAQAAVVNWEGNAPSGLIGDGLLWTNGLNWTGDLLPAGIDDLVFGNPLATVGPIHLSASQTANSLSFTESYSLGAFGSNLVLTNTTGNIAVTSGDFVTMNASYGGTNGITLSGGGSLFLNHPLPRFAGNITVNGAGTTLVHRQEGPAPQYNGVGSAQEFGRNDALTLGFTTAARTITLTNGGIYKVLGGGFNVDGGTKSFVIGTGGGTVNIAAGYQVMNLDDANQLANAVGNTLTKAGDGRLTITGAAADSNALAGNVVVDNGMLDFGKLSGAANTRFNGMTGTTSTVVGTNSLTINSGGILMLNSTTVGNLDVASVILNDGSLVSGNGQSHEIGMRTQGGTTPASTLQINGTATILARDLYGAQTARNFAINSGLTGSGTLSILPSTNAGGTSRLVINRNVGSTFTGIFRLNENAVLEANPRFNPTTDFGKVLADGDVDFMGWGGTLDLRDSENVAARQLGYTTNDIAVKTTQLGALNIISTGRATTATGTGHQFNFGGLTIGSHRLAFAGNSSYNSAFTNTVTLSGDAVLEMRTAPLALLNAAALTEDAAGRSLTLVKSGVGNAGAVDVTSGGAISVSQLNVAGGGLNLRGANGAIGAAFGGAAPVINVHGGTTSATSGPTFGTLHLDGNGTVLGVAAGNNNNRIVDSATLNLRGNSVLRLTSTNATGTTETIGTANISGHGLIDVVKTGTAPTPVALTLTSLNLTGTLPTVNLTGTTLGTSGANTSRIVIGGAVTGNLGAQFHSGNEWAKYSTTVESGFELGATAFVALDYTIDNTAVDTGWAVGQQLKLTSATGSVMSGDRNVNRLNLQLTAGSQSVNLAGFRLNLDEGGLLVSGQTTGIVDGATGAVPSGTAGLSAGTTNGASPLYVHNNSQLDLRTPVVDNALGGSVSFVKSGTGTLRLIHQGLGVGTGTAAITPFTATPWTSTLTGSWVVNDGTLEVQRGEFLGGRPLVLNGGTLFVNQPVTIANSGTILPNWGNDVTVNSNVSLVMDDNGESTDPNAGGAALLSFGSLKINNAATLSFGSFGNGQPPTAALGLTGGQDAYFPGGTVIAGGKATFNLGVGRGTTTSSLILGGAVSGNGFDVVAYGGAPSTLVLGAGSADAAANTYTDVPVIYGGTLRLNKANGTDTIVNTPGAEDLVINGGSVFWGAGDHGNLTTQNNINLTNNGLAGGIAPTSPAGVQAAGQNQIPDTANITLLSGTLGESDRITNEKFGTLIQKNGTLNVGLGKIEVDSATISGGAMGFDRGGHFKAGALSYLPGAYDQSVFTGLPTPGAYTTLEVGAGGISLTGQNITLGNGFGGNVAGAGGRLLLGGNLTFTGDDQIGGSYGRKGIFVQTGSNFRELGGSHVDLMGGTRDFNIINDSLYTITANITNGGLTKSGNGTLILEPYQGNAFAGAITVNAGVLSARGDGAFGTSAGGVTISSGATVKLESGWNYGDAFTVSGQGALVAGDANVRELGALVSEIGTNRLNGGLTLAADATIASNIMADPSATPGGSGAAYRISNFVIASPAGVTGSGTLGLSGHGDGVIVSGINTTAGGLTKDGAGRWTLSRAGTYIGTTTIAAGALRITDGGALGTTAAGTTVLGGSLELLGGISTSEPLTLNGAGMSTQSGAIVNIGGSNTLAGAVTLNSATTLRSDAGRLITAGITGSGRSLTLSGPADGVINGGISLGTVAGNALTKSGTGSWVINGGATMTGGTRIEGGNLVLGSGGAVLDAASALTMSGGHLQNGTSAQTAGGLNLFAGGGTVGGGSGLTVGAIARSAGASAVFTGTVNTSTGNVNGILGAYATVGNHWAAADGGGNVVGLSSYTPLSTAAAADNAELLTGNTLTAPVTVNSLKQTSGSGLALGANSLTLGSGGLLTAGSTNAGITGTGLIAGATANDELILHAAGSNFDIAAPLIGAGTGGLTKTGNGKLVLSGASAFTGPININAGTLSIVGPGGTTHPTALGSATGPRDLTLNGGTFEVVGGDYDANASTMQYVIGSAGGTIRSTLGATISINDGSANPLAATQLRGSGDLTFTGGGRYNLSGGAPEFSGFTGNTTVDGGILIVGHQSSLGGRQEQLLTLNSGSSIINNAGFGLGLNGLPNNISAQGGVEFFATGINRVYGGNIQLAGTNTIALMERDTLAQERQVYFNGRVSGTGVTLNVFGANNAAPFYLASGSNDLTGTINLKANAVLEARTPGSLGANAGDVTINLEGANSRLFLRHWQNADFRANVVVGDTAEINTDRLVNYAGGANQLLSINNLTVAGDKILTFGGGNTFTTRVGGTATYNGNAIINTVLGASGVIFENGINFTSAASLDKRGATSVVLTGPSNHSDGTFVQQGFLILQGANGSLPNTSSVNLRGGELRVDNSAVINTNRINDAAAISLGGGILRITGAETLGTVTAVPGTTQIVNNAISDTVPNPLTLSGFTRQAGSVLNVGGTDLGAQLGATVAGQARVSSRILVPGLAASTGANVLHWAVSTNEFVQYSTDLDSGVTRGLVQINNNTITGYNTDPAETTWTNAIIARTTGTTVTTALVADRTLQAIKMDGGARGTNESGRRINLDGRKLVIETGGPASTGGLIIQVNNTQAIGNSSATAATLTAGRVDVDSELVLQVNAGTLEIGRTSTNGTALGLTGDVVISDNGTGKVSLVKSGGGTVQLRNLANANTHTGGTHINQGTLDLFHNGALGAATNPVNLNGGTLLFNVPSAAAAGTGGPLGGFGNEVNVRANSTIILDNGTGTNTDTDIALGALNISGPYTLGMRGFDLVDASFTSATHTFAGTPTLDMAQAAGGSTASTFTINGAIAGSGFRVESSGASPTTAGVLQIGGGEAIANTYAGKVSLMLGGNSGGLVVQLNKAVDTNAITGDLEINGGTVRNLTANQIADTANLTINQGQYDAFGQSETIASVTMNGGNFRTSSAGTGNNTVTVTGDFNAMGLDDLTGSVDGVAVNSNSTLAVNGTLRLNGYSRSTMGGTASTMILGGLEMTGTIFSQGGAGSLLRLNGDVATLPSSNVARLGATTTAGAQIQLNGTRTFNIADGGAGIDLAVSSALTDSTAPIAAGALIKTGAGVMLLEGAALANAYTGTTAVNEGSLILSKTLGTNAIPAGSLTIGDGVGGARADRVILRNSNQIADTNDVVLGSSGLLDLETFNTSETIQSLAGSGAVDMGPGSLLTVNGPVSTAYSGSIEGSGALTKNGGSTLTLSGVSDYSGATTVVGGNLQINGTLKSSPITVNTGAVLSGTGTFEGALTVADGGIFAPGNSPGTLTTTNAASFGALSVLNYELNGGVTTVGGGINDLFTGVTQLTLDGVVNISETMPGSFLSAALGDTWRLINYTGTLTDNLLTVGTSPALSGGNLLAVDTTTPGQVNLVVVPETSSATLLGLATMFALRRRRKQA